MNMKSVFILVQRIIHITYKVLILSTSLYEILIINYEMRKAYDDKIRLILKENCDERVKM